MVVYEYFDQLHVLAASKYEILLSVFLIPASMLISVGIDGEL